VKDEYGAGKSEGERLSLKPSGTLYKEEAERKTEQEKNYISTGSSTNARLMILT